MWGPGVSGTRASDQANKRADVGTGRRGFLVNDGKGESGMRCVDLQRLTHGPLVSASGCACAGVEIVGAGLSALLVAAEGRGACMGLAGPRGWSWVAVWAGLEQVFGLVLFFLFSFSDNTQPI